MHYDGKNIYINIYIFKTQTDGFPTIYYLSNIGVNHQRAMFWPHI